MAPCKTPLSFRPRSARGAAAAKGQLPRAATLLRQAAGRAAAVLAASWLVAGCLFVPREVGERMQQELLALRGEMARLSQDQKAMAEAREHGERQANDAIASVRADLDTVAQQGRRADADIGSQLEQVQGDIMRLRGAVEDNDHRLTESEARLQAELQTRLSVLKQAAAQTEREATSNTARFAAPRNKKELLGYARSLLAAGNRADARGVLRDVVRRYGKEAGLADEALLLLANAAFEDGRIEPALRDYVRLVDGFAKSRLAAEAYYKIGVCSDRLKRQGDASTFYAEVISSYPNSPWASKAREGMRLLKASSASNPAASGRGTAGLEPATKDGPTSGGLPAHRLAAPKAQPNAADANARRKATGSPGRGPADEPADSRAGQGAGAP